MSARAHVAIGGLVANRTPGIEHGRPAVAVLPAEQLRKQGVIFAQRRSFDSCKCDDSTLEASTYLHIERWGDADLAVALLGKALNDQALGEPAIVVVEPAFIYCAQ